MSSQSDQFKKLQQEWYQKLKDHDFEDIENTSLPDGPILISWHSYHFMREGYGAFKQETLEYYLSTSELIHTHRFQNAKHKMIWELHSDGLSSREIAEEINKKNVVVPIPCNKTYEKSMINNIISEIRKKIA